MFAAFFVVVVSVKSHFVLVDFFLFYSRADTVVIQSMCRRSQFRGVMPVMLLCC